MITLERSTLVLVGAAALAVAGAVRQRLFQPTSPPSQGQLDYLDRNSYAKNMRVRMCSAGEERGHKLQMMVIGARRFNPAKRRCDRCQRPARAQAGEARRVPGLRSCKVAYNKKLGKWILITGASRRSLRPRRRPPTASTTIRA